MAGELESYLISDARVAFEESIVSKTAVTAGALWEEWEAITPCNDGHVAGEVWYTRRFGLFGFWDSHICKTTLEGDMEQHSSRDS